MIHFLRLVEAPVKHGAPQSFNKIGVLLAGEKGHDGWGGYLQHLNALAFLHVSQEVTEPF